MTAGVGGRGMEREMEEEDIWKKDVRRL